LLYKILHLYYYCYYFIKTKKNIKKCKL